MAHIIDQVHMQLNFIQQKHTMHAYKRKNDQKQPRIVRDR